MFLRIGKLLTPLVVVAAVVGGSALAAGSGEAKTRSG